MRSKLQECEKHLRYALWVIKKNAGLDEGNYLDEEHEAACAYLPETAVQSDSVDGAAEDALHELDQGVSGE